MMAHRVRDITTSPFPLGWWRKPPNQSSATPVEDEEDHHAEDDGSQKQNELAQTLPTSQSRKRTSSCCVPLKLNGRLFFH